MHPSTFIPRSLRKPNWRWQRVLDLCRSSPPSRSLPTDDQFIRRAKQFWLQYRSVRFGSAEYGHLATLEPDLMSAVYLALGKNNRQFPDIDTTLAKIESRVLANHAPFDIAGKVDDTENTVRWYETLFFDVRPRLKACDWIFSHVILPAIDLEVMRIAKGTARSRPARAVQSTPFLLLASYIAGPKAAGEFLDIPQDRPTIGAVATFLKSTITQRSFRAVLLTDVGRYNLEVMLNAAIKLQELEAKAEGGDRAAGTVEQQAAIILAELGPSLRVIHKAEGMPSLREVRELTGRAGPSVEPSDAELYQEAGINPDS